MSERSHSGHNHARTSNESRLWWAFGLTATYLVVQVIGGLITHSLALLSDAAHMMTDVVGLAIAIAAIRIAKRPADTQRTFGYYRFEILAAALNAVILFLVAVYIFYEALQRFREPVAINSWGMMGIATVGLIVNLIGMRLLQGGSAGSLNVKGAYLEALADTVGSAGVIAAAIVIKFTGWWQVDPIVAVAIGLWVLPRTWTLFKESLNILLEGVPRGLALDDIRKTLLGIPGVSATHELHVWAISSGNNSLTAHLVVDPTIRTEQQILADVHQQLREKFNISHTTIQIETVACAIHEDDCRINVAAVEPKYGAHADHEQRP
jgi:cobalt-zinc-cadmium efflux system protein